MYLHACACGFNHRTHLLQVFTQRNRYTLPPYCTQSARAFGRSISTYMFAANIHSLHAPTPRTRTAPNADVSLCVRRLDPFAGRCIHPPPCASTHPPRTFAVHIHHTLLPHICCANFCPVHPPYAFTAPNTDTSFCVHRLDHVLLPWRPHACTRPAHPFAVPFNLTHTSRSYATPIRCTLRLRSYAAPVRRTHSPHPFTAPFDLALLIAS
ncbi:hypothetical protein B0H16DRAFT_1547906 [Mycena metata]|uniref:Uncharacterized protein n=1 Tax=Mycena metata TaxID=1033252 RepID=A0AAD7NA35_9AGAR|nr:hypothetical protein B0H16DRAFT_1547906 [Mycena metata]